MKKDNYFGGIEVLTQDYINGFLIDTTEPNRKIYLKILIGEQIIGYTLANIEIEKLKNLGYEDNQCGFYFKFPKKLNTNELTNVKILPIDSNKTLKFIHNTYKHNNRNININKVPIDLKIKASNLSDLFIVNHIPKTAGTSLRTTFNDSFAKQNILYHYNSIGACSPEIWKWKFAQNQTISDIDIINIIIERPIYLIIGHFGFPEQFGFDNLLSIFPNAKSITFFRNPKDHICSLYLFSKKYFGESRSFEEYISLNYTRNYQTNALCGLKIEEFSFIGLVEMFSESIFLLNRKFDLNLKNVFFNINSENKINSHYNYSDFANSTVWKKFEEFNQSDIKLYNMIHQNLLQEAKKIPSVSIKKTNETKDYLNPDFLWAKSLNIYEWAKSLAYSKGPNNEILPPLPPSDIQSMYVGSDGYNSFLEANIFIEKMMNTISDHGLELNKNMNILDCGVGWGRLYRSMLRYFNHSSILGIDIDEKAIDICQNTMPNGRFSLISKTPPYKNLKESSFDIVYLYSVLSHLSESGFLSMFKEFSRILKKNGFLIFTTLKSAHLKVWESRINSVGYGSILKKVGFNYKKWEKQMKKGNFLFVPFGGGDSSRPSDYYGETIISEKYLIKACEKQKFKILLFEESDDLPQTFVALQKIF
ncbi:MAG: class I SAM-dependent methyltransferase [Prolixibacteraceae bacterium]|nr:class I SAM-dependent methyltransferase [Prolixibacteraceae bacterium]